MHIVFAVGWIAFEVDVTIVFHILGHLADREQFLDHLAGQLVFARLLDRVVVEFEVIFVNDELHAGQFLHFAQFLHRELRLRHTAADEQVQDLRLVARNAFIHVVGNVCAGLEVVGVAHELARHVHRHVAAADHRDFLGLERPFAHTRRVAVVPLDELGGAVHAFKVGARDAQRFVLDRAGREEHGIVALEQVLERHVFAELHVAVQVDVRVVERLFERRRDELDRRVVGGHAVAHQTERHRQLFEEVDARVRTQTQFVAELGELAQENVGRVDAGGARADYSNTKFRILSHGTLE